MKKNDPDTFLKIICWGAAVLVGLGWWVIVEEPYSFLLLPIILWLVMTPHMMRSPTLATKEVKQC